MDSFYSPNICFPLGRFFSGSYPPDYLKCYKAKSMKDERSLMSAVDEENMPDDDGEKE